MKPQLKIFGFVLLAAIGLAAWMAAPAAAQSSTGSNPAALSAPQDSPTAHAAQAPAPARLSFGRSQPWYKSRTAKTVGLGTGGGALIGGLIHGGKGAVIGAMSGAAAGYIYERKTRRK
jgi:hypothetical protein